MTTSQIQKRITSKKKQLTKAEREGKSISFQSELSHDVDVLKRCLIHLEKANHELTLLKTK